jgi:hypothetical protein
LIMSSLMSRLWMTEAHLTAVTSSIFAAYYACLAACEVASAMHAMMDECSFSMAGVTSINALAFLFPTILPSEAGAGVAAGSYVALALVRVVCAPYSSHASIRAKTWMKLNSASLLSSR